jgi:NAD(P)-dependent dehydrogenase (short-subunit alcohol dehydrogenase family)
MLAQKPNGSGTRFDPVDGQRDGDEPSPEFFATHAYAAAKAATVGLMTTMAAAYARDRIRVNTVAPGLTDTHGCRAAGDEQIRAYAARKQPLPAR